MAFGLVCIGRKNSTQFREHYLKKGECGMRKEFEITQAQLDTILEACKPVRYIIVGNLEPSSPQENANRAWQSLANEKGFVWDSVQPVSGKSNLFFTAEIEDN